MTEESIFVAKDPSTIAWGTINEIYVRDRDLAGPLPCRSVSTAFANNLNQDKFAEIGWADYDLFGEKWVVFTEAQVGEQLRGPDWHGSIDVSQWHRFKVANVDSSLEWRFWVDYNADGSFDRIYPDFDTDLNFAMAYVMGETSRWGIGSGASDHHRDLEFKTCATCGWVDWDGNRDPKGNAPGKDNLHGWEWSRVSGNEYQIVQCTPQASC